MSRGILTIGVGDAGCRLAAATLEQLAPEAAGEGLFFRTAGATLRPRAVLALGDPGRAEALGGALEASPLSFAPGCLCVGPAGAEGSFARGLAQSSGLLPTLLDRIDGEREAADIRSLLLCCGLADGTGSGLGAALAARLRKDHAKKQIIAVAVLPVPATPLALVNAALGLDALLTNADAVVLVDGAAAEAISLHAGLADADRAVAAALALPLGALQAETLTSAAMFLPLVPIPALKLLVPGYVPSAGPGACLPLLAGNSQLLSVAPWGQEAGLRGLLCLRGEADDKARDSAVQAGLQRPWIAVDSAPALAGARAPGAPALGTLLNHPAVAERLDSALVGPFRALVEADAFLARPRDAGLEPGRPGAALGRLEQLVAGYRGLV